MHRRRRRFAGLLLLASLLLVAACERWSLQTPRQPPKLVCTAPSHDLGRIQPGDTVHHAYTLRNAGELLLRIDNLRTACDCTAVLAGTNPLPANASATVEVHCETRHWVGRRTQSISVYSNDPTQPVTMLEVAGEVTAALTADPPQLYVGHLRRGAAATRPSRLLAGAHAFPAERVDVSGAILTATLEKPAAGPAEQRIRLAVRPDALLGAFSETVSVQTSDRQAVLTVPVSGVVDGDVVVSPAQLRLRLIGTAAPLIQSLAIYNRGKRPLHVLGAALAPPLGTARIATVRDGGEYRITMALQPPWHVSSSGRIEGVVRLQTDHPEQSVIDVPFSARLAEGR